MMERHEEAAKVGNELYENVYILYRNCMPNAKS